MLRSGLGRQVAGHERAGEAGADFDDELDDDADEEEAVTLPEPMPPAVEAALQELNKAAERFDPVAFRLVADRVRSGIVAHPDEFAVMIARGTPVRRWIWGAISNAAGDLVESGEFHVYRGALDPEGPGDGLIRIFDAAADEMVRLKGAESDFAARQKAALRKNIAEVG